MCTFSPAMSKRHEHDASQTELRPYLVYGVSPKGDRFRESSTLRSEVRLDRVDQDRPGDP
jgi:hypothetical protein